MKVRIEDEHDGFSITLVAFNDADIKALNGVVRRWRFDQEDDRSSMAEIFNVLGHDCEYEEVY